MNQLSANLEYKRKSIVKKTIYEVILVISVILMLLPFLGVLYLSIKPDSQIMAGDISLPDRIYWENYVEALKKIDFLTMFKNSFVITVITLIGELILGVTAGYALTRFKFGKQKLQNFFYLFFIIGIIVPGYVYLFPLYKMNFAIGVIDTPWAIILPHLGWSAPMNIMMMYSAYSMVPNSLEEAAVIDGCGRFRLLTKVNIPVIKSAIVSMLILNFLAIWNEFAVSVVMLTSKEVLTLAIAPSFFIGQYKTAYGAMTAGVVMLCIPQIAIFSLFQKYVSADVAAGAVKG